MGKHVAVVAVYSVVVSFLVIPATLCALYGMSASTSFTANALVSAAVNAWISPAVHAMGMCGLQAVSLPAQRLLFGAFAPALHLVWVTPLVTLGMLIWRSLTRRRTAQRNRHVVAMTARLFMVMLIANWVYFYIVIFCVVSHHICYFLLFVYAGATLAAYRPFGVPYALLSALSFSLVIPLVNALILTVALAVFRLLKRRLTTGSQAGNIDI